MSRRNLIAHLNKRRRLHGRQKVSIPEQDITRSEKFWFEDGSIVLQAETTQFHVHRTILASQSDFFRDMFMLPQPEDQLTVEGSPLVICAQDSVKDWENVLMVIYHSMKLERGGSVLPWDFVVSILRLGKKYQMEMLVHAGMDRLKSCIPTHNNKTERWWTCNFLTDIPPLFAYMNLAQELGIESILPMCYSACLVNATMREIMEEESDSPPDDVHVTLNAQIQKLLILSRQEFLVSLRAHAMGWIIDFEQQCRNEGCSKAIDKGLITCGRGSIILPTLDADEHLSESLFKELCKQCVRHARSLRDADIDNLWERIPSYFDLPDWEDLKDFVN